MVCGMMNDAPADVIVPNWDLGKSVAFISLLHHRLIKASSLKCVTVQSSAWVSEVMKHASIEQGWSCIPLAVETYGCWRVNCS